MNWPKAFFFAAAISGIVVLIVWNDYKKELAKTVETQEVIIAEMQEQQCDYISYDKKIDDLRGQLENSKTKIKQLEALKKLASRDEQLKKDNCYADWTTGEFKAYKGPNDKYKTLICYFDDKTKTWKKQWQEFQTYVQEKL